MNRYISAVAACIGSIAMAACVLAWTGQPTTQPTEGSGKVEKGGRSTRWGYAPINKLSNITDEQKMKINEIHRKFLADRKALEDKQDTDVMALLTDAQKMELEKMKADEKAKAAEHRKAGKKDKDEDDKDK